MRRISSLFFMACLSVAMAARGQDSPRPAWQWTDEERLAVRFDPESMRTRLRNAKADGNVKGDAGERDVVWGTRNPELFMPFEVYRYLVTTAFTAHGDARESFREGYLENAVELELGPDFWDRLEEAIRPDLQARDEIRTLAAKLADASEEQKAAISHEVEQTERLGCRAREQGLEAARREFGQEVFDRFLYVAVAPSMGLASVDSQVSADHVRYLSGGCR